MSAKPDIITAAVLVIGDEILSGRTKDKNIGYIAEYLDRDRHRSQGSAGGRRRCPGDRRGDRRPARQVHICVHHRRN